MSRQRILIVDDELDLLEIMSTYLKMGRIDADIETVSSAVLALKLMVNTKFDVIVSDIMMPGMTGLQMLEDLNARDIMTPVIFVSGFGDRKVVSMAWRLGAFDFVDKPIDPQRLLENVQTALVTGESFNRYRRDRARAQR